MASGFVAAGASYLVNEQLKPAVTEHLIPTLKDNLISFAKEQFRSVWCLKDDIDKISERMKTYRNVKEAAEKKQFEDQDVREWLSDLKSVEYDVEDVVCDYQDLVVRAEENGQGVVRRCVMQAKDGIVLLLCGVPLYCLKDVLPLPLTPRIEIAHRLRSINKNLAKIEQREASLPILAGESIGNSDASITTSAVAPRMWEYEDEEMIGRDEIKMEIKRALLDHAAADIEESSRSKLLVVGIVGAGGMGKTTLAHNIYNDKDVIEAYESKEWLYIGDKFDLKGIMNKIIGNDERNKLEDEDELHSAMKNKLREKSMLIILDDTWCSDHDEWNLLGRSLSKGIKSCALVTTTRNKAVAKAICRESQYLEHELTNVSDDECLKIFKRWAFAGRNAKRYREFEGQSTMVVEKMKGVPLAAKIIGGLLYNHLDDRQKWINIENDVIGLNTDGRNVVDMITKLSYLHLPSHLRPCFAFCAMFPKGFRFDKEDLIHRWIVQGYIQSEGIRLIEDVGKGYFADLHQRSLFQVVDLRYRSEIEYYTMHDLIHDFAQKVFTNGCRVNASDVEDPQDKINEISSSIRHLTFKDEESGSSSIRHLSSLDVCNKLRTLRCYASSSNIKYVFGNQFRHLRLLIIGCYNMKNLPDSIQHLKLLRYLNVSGTAITSLSEKICDLVNLEYLVLPPKCEVLHEGMGKLVKLRCLRRISLLKESKFPNFKGIGKLTCLQGRNLRFTVLNESGWRISELKDLNCLRGRLYICGLKNVKSMREAEQACLKEKKHLERLTLRWGLPKDFRMPPELVDGHAVVEDDAQIERQILESLRPPPCLLSLQIDDQRRATLLQALPRWMDDLPSTLVKLTLRVRVIKQRLPTLGRLPSLKKLHIGDLCSVRKIDPKFYGDDGEGTNNSSSSYFPSLEEFTLESMDSLEEWEVPSVREHINDNVNSGDDQLQRVPTSSTSSSSVFPRLKDLNISGCPKLFTLSSILPYLTVLQKMNIEKCDELTSLVEQKEGDLGRILPCLSHLSIWKCPKLTPVTPLTKAWSQVLLEAPSPPPSVGPSSINCDDLKQVRQLLPNWIDDLPSTLVELTLGWFDNWERLPMLGRLRSLKNLTIENFDCVRKIGPEFYGDSCRGGIVITHNYFPSLEKLRIWSMWQLEEWEVPPLSEQSNDDSSHDNTNDQLQHASTSSSLLTSVFPCLRDLSISYCPKLRALSSVLPHLTALQKMEIRGCEELTSLVELKGGRRGLTLSSLNDISIWGCPKLFAEAAVMKADINAGLAGLVSLSPSLNTLEIGCASLNEGAQVSRWMMHNLPSTLLVQLQLEKYGDDQPAPPVSHDDDEEGGCWEHLPTLGHLPFLRELSIINLLNVRRIGSEFYGGSSSSSLLDGGGDERDNIAFKTTEDAGEESTSSTNIITSAYFPRLEEFSIYSMKSLVEWGMPPPVEGQMNDVNNNTRDDEELHGGGCGRGGHRLHHASSSSTLFISVFPCLRVLRICECPKLRSLSSVLPRLTALQDLIVRDCPELVWLVGGDGASEEDDDRYSLPPSLQWLSIRRCPLLEERWGEGGVDHPKIPPTTRVLIE